MTSVSVPSSTLSSTYFYTVKRRINWMNKKIKDKTSISLDCVYSRCKNVANLLLGQSVIEFMISIHGY